MYHVYVIESEPKTSWYIGYTTDLRRRITEHNLHKNISTAKQEQWKLIYCETYCNKMDALGREKFLKSGSGRNFLKKQMRHYLEEGHENYPSGEAGRFPPPAPSNTH